MSNKEQITDAGIDPVVVESLNLTSGEYAAVFWNGMYDVFGSTDILKNTESIFTVLNDSGYYEEAFFLFHSYIEILSLERNIELDIIDKIPELKEPFMDEFLKDTAEIIIDFEYEEYRTV